MLTVLVVPQTEEFRTDILQKDLIYINNNLGIPNLDGRMARYAAPCWLYGDRPGVHRLYHITGSSQDGQSTVLTLGNSFVLPEGWNNIGQPRRFEYHPLSEFGFVEVQPGFLLKYRVQRDYAACPSAASAGPSGSAGHCSSASKSFSTPLQCWPKSIVATASQSVVPVSLYCK